MKIRNLIPILALAGVAVATGLTGGVSANASTPAASASTVISNRPDGGHSTVAGGVWANDNFTRVLTITPGTDCGTLTSGISCFDATIDDSGTFTTIPGRGAPNQNEPAAATDATIGSPAVTGKLTGQYSYVFTASNQPTGVVPTTEDDSNGVINHTSTWYELAFPSGTVFGGPGGGAYSWVYKTACETWTDSSTNSDGNATGDGNITGKACPAPAAVVPSGAGDVINKYLNGLDVFRQADTYNNRIIVFPVKSGDPAVQFDVVPVGKGAIAFEYSPRGVDTGYCVSEAVGSQPKGSAKTGLVLRPCFTPWEAFKIKDAGNGSLQLVNVATGDVIQPNGTRSQFTGVKASTAAGSYFGWNTPGVPVS